MWYSWRGSRMNLKPKSFDANYIALDIQLAYVRYVTTIWFHDICLCDICPETFAHTTFAQRDTCPDDIWPHMLPVWFLTQKKVPRGLPLDYISKKHYASGNHHANLFRSWPFCKIAKTLKIASFWKAHLCTSRMVRVMKKLYVIDAC
jgi:hypothetical protein